MTEQITTEVQVHAPAEKAWDCFTKPEAIMHWNQASDDWHCPSAINDLRVGGAFRSHMEAKDGSQGFDFSGVYTEVVPNERIAYTMDGEDARRAIVTFTSHEGGTRVTVSFDPEIVNPPEMQRAGWQAILDNYKAYTEAHAS